MATSFLAASSSAWTPLTRAAVLPRVGHASRRGSAMVTMSLTPSPLSSLPSPSLLLAVERDAAGSDVSIVDTVLDVAVYALLLAVVGLTLYSLYVTLDQSNKQYGGWVKKEDEDLDEPIRGDNDRLRSGAKYDPVTDQWTYPTRAEVAAKKAQVGRAPAAAVEDGGNRYEKRMAKKQKQKQRQKKR